jgi:hypothetical protein
MPVPEVDKLDTSSADEQVKAAISACIAAEVNGGRPQDQAIAMCYSMVSQKTGKSLNKPNEKGV